MQKIAIAIHGGAGADSEYIKQNKKDYEAGLKDAITKAYSILKKGSTQKAIQKF